MKPLRRHRQVPPASPAVKEPTAEETIPLPKEPPLQEGGAGKVTLSDGTVVDLSGVKMIPIDVKQ